MAQMLFYENPVALNREQHRKLRLNPNRAGQFGFARETNSVLLSAIEISEAAKDYPIVFVSTNKDEYVPVALLGLGDRENLFVGADGNWQPNTYLPAFVRRYPFVLSEVNDGLMVCIDEASSALNETEGEPLFDEEGKETKLLESSVEFLRWFHAQMERSREFTKRLAELELLVPRNIQMQRGEEKPEVFDGFFIIDEEKLRGLKDEQVLELFRNGYLFLIHAHLCSLSNADRLLRMRVDRLAAATASAA